MYIYPLAEDDKVHRCAWIGETGWLCGYSLAEKGVYLSTTH